MDIHDRCVEAVTNTLKQENIALLTLVAGSSMLARPWGTVGSRANHSASYKFNQFHLYEDKKKAALHVNIPWNLL